MTVVVACTVGSAELVAITESGKLPRGVPCVPVAPRHPANASTPSKPTKNIPSRSLAFVLFRPPANIPTSVSGVRDLLFPLSRPAVESPPCLPSTSPVNGAKSKGIPLRLTRSLKGTVAGELGVLSLVDDTHQAARLQS